MMQLFTLFFRSFLPWLVFTLVWSLLSETEFVDPLFLASPSDTVDALISGLRSGELVVATASTLFRTLCGFLFAVSIGVPLGLLLGGIPSVNQYFSSFVDGLRSIPATALFPVFLLVFGVGDISKIAVVAFVCMWAMTIYTSYGVVSSGEMRRFLLKLHNVSSFQYLVDGLFFPALPSIVAGMRTTISLALVVTVSTEMIIGTSFGLGQSIYNAQIVYQIPKMYASIFLSALSGLSLNGIFYLLSKKITHWQDT